MEVSNDPTFFPEPIQSLDDHIYEDRKNRKRPVSPGEESVNVTSKKCYLKCSVQQGGATFEGYLFSDNNAYIMIRKEEYQWRFRSDEIFYCAEHPNRNYMMGHRTWTNCAKVYDNWYASDYIYCDNKTKRLVNLDLKRVLARHLNGYYYWASEAEVASSEYAPVDCYMEEIE